MQKLPITYFPVPTQRQLLLNREAMRGKAYERFWNTELFLDAEVAPAIQQAMDPADALRFEDLDQLLEPGYLRVENGFCELADGTGYVASRVAFPGCSGDMYRWWFWWHAVESARYTLWYPHNHVRNEPLDRSKLSQPGLTHEQRYVGTTHLVDEYIGPDLVKIAIHFIDPAELGLDTQRFRQAGIVGHACARVSLRDRPLDAVTMVHLARKTREGIEQRSRYWIGHKARLRVPGGSLPVDGLSSALGIKGRMAGARVAYEQLLHDQIEFTHLATFLADIYKAFGPSVPE